MRLFVNGTPGREHGEDGHDRGLDEPAADRWRRIYGQFFSGLIDEVRIYNVALTAAQIQTDMTTPVGRTAAIPGADGAGDADRDRRRQHRASILSWGAATDNVGVTGYRMERCQGAGCTQFRRRSPRRPARHDATATPALPPRRATAIASVRPTPPATSAATSNAATATTPSAAGHAGCRRAPATLTANAVGAAAVDLSWARGDRQRGRHRATRSSAARAPAAPTSPRSGRSPGPAPAQRHRARRRARATATASARPTPPATSAATRPSRPRHDAGGAGHQAPTAPPA